MICRALFSGSPATNAKYERMWGEFEHGEVNEERAYDEEVTQDKVNFKDRLTKEEANFQLQQTQRQEEF